MRSNGFQNIGVFDVNSGVVIGSFESSTTPVARSMSNTPRQGSPVDGYVMTAAHPVLPMATTSRTYHPPEPDSIDSYAYGTEVVGGILSLRNLRAELVVLSDDLDQLADQYRGIAGTR
ncbi:MAG: hypothetical protein MUQ27_08920 [Acidimicrobiia bacterium]|nr:hypothetical protein [Acidimicrobiia bacterium]